jgi:hypothetical protein
MWVQVHTLVLLCRGLGRAQDALVGAMYCGQRAPFSPANFLHAWWCQAERLAEYQQQVSCSHGSIIYSRVCGFVGFRGPAQLASKPCQCRPLCSLGSQDAHEFYLSALSALSCAVLALPSQAPPEEEEPRGAGVGPAWGPQTSQVGWE